MRRNIAAFVSAKLSKWTVEEAQTTLGEPERHSYHYGQGQSVLGDIYTFSDPSGVYRFIDLDFDSATKRLSGVYIYPVSMTYDDAKKLWGESATLTRNADGTQVRLYPSLRLRIYLDKQDNVINLGFF